MKRTKKCLAIILALAMLCCCFPISGLVAQATETENVYNAADYFASNTENSNTGVWQYESRKLVNGEYVYEDMTYSDKWISSNELSTIQLVTGDLVYSAADGTTKVLALQSFDQTTEAVLTFVAPKSGLISVDMVNGAVLAPGSQSGSNLVRFSMLRNEECIVSKEGLDASMRTFFADPSTFYVEVGDKVRFVVGRNKALDMTYGTRFNPQIEYIKEYSYETDCNYSYNAYNDFSSTDNPNGVWAYQTLSGGTYTNETWQQFWNTIYSWGSPSFGCMYAASSDQVTGEPAIRARAETKDPVLTFTAPYSGKINVSMANGAVFAPVSTSDGGQIKFTFKHNDTVVKSIDALDSSKSHNNRFFTDTVELTVKAGDVLRFIVHKNNTNGTADAYFNPQIDYTKLTPDTSYNAYDDFSTTDNPNGAWGYQTLSGGTYSNMAFGTTYSTMWGNVNYALIAGVTSDKVTGATALGLRPEPTTTDAVLTFTAPYSGNINVKMANGGVFAPTATSGSVKFTFKHNDTVVKSIDALNSSNNHNNRFFTDTVELTVNAGDVLRFVVHRNSGTNDPWTYFNPQIDYTKLFPPTIFNAYSDYSTTDNPNGVWAYQTASNGAYTDMVYGASYATMWGNVNYGVIQAVTSDKVTGAPAIGVRPEPTTKDVVLAFTAPYSGKISVEMANGGVFAPSATSGSGLMKFTFKHNDTVVKSIDALDSSNNSAANRFFTDAVELTVKAGDVLRFVMHRNKSGSDPWSYFNPQITYNSLESENDEPKGVTYYVSSSTGNDANAGTVSTAPYKSLAKLQDVALGENDKVLLKAGDTFAEQWVLNNVKGTKDAPVIIGAYGDVETDGKPCINPAIVEDDATATLEIAAPVLKLNNATCVEISGLQITGSGVGIHLDYTNSFNNENVVIKDCDFTDITGFTIQDYRGNSDRSNGVNITGVYQMASAICASVDNYNISVNDPALIGLYIDACTTNNCGTMFTTAASINNTNEGGSQAINGLYITDSTMVDNDYYGIYVDGRVKGGYIAGCTIDGCGAADKFSPGTAGILLSVKDFAVVNNEIKNQKRAGVDYDGVAIDFEHLCDNVIVRNNYFHDNTGAGMLIYNRDGDSSYANVNCQIINNLFVNNATEAKGTYYPHDDPYADIRLTSGESYAADNCTISGNSYYNTISGYKFVNDRQKVSGTNTIENNTALAEASSSYLETKETVLNEVEDLFGGYNKSEYKFGKFAGKAEPDAAVIDSDSFVHSEDFGTSLDGTVWQYKYYTTGGGFEDMTYNSESKQWQYGDTTALVNKNVMHPHSVGQTVLTFVAPRSGRIRISMEDVISVNSADGVYITVLNDNLETLAEPLWVTAKNSQTFADIYTSVQKDDVIYFCLSKCKTASNDATTIKPVVDYVYHDIKIDDSNALNILDLIRIKKIALGDVAATAVADFNCDGSINSVDIVQLRRYMLGIF